MAAPHAAWQNSFVSVESLNSSLWDDMESWLSKSRRFHWLVLDVPRLPLHPRGIFNSKFNGKNMSLAFPEIVSSGLVSYKGEFWEGAFFWVRPLTSALNIAYNDWDWIWGLLYVQQELYHSVNSPSPYAMAQIHFCLLKPGSCSTPSNLIYGTYPLHIDRERERETLFVDCKWLKGNALCHWLEHYLGFIQM